MVEPTPRWPADRKARVAIPGMIPPLSGAVTVSAAAVGGATSGDRPGRKLSCREPGAAARQPTTAGLDPATAGPPAGTGLGSPGEDATGRQAASALPSAKGAANAPVGADATARPLMVRRAGRIAAERGVASGMG